MVAWTTSVLAIYLDRNHIPLSALDSLGASSLQSGNFAWGILGSNLLGGLRDLLVAFGILAAYEAVGRRGIEWAGWDFPNRPLRWAAQGALGALVYAWLFLALGLAGLWFRPLLLLVLAAGFLDFAWAFFRSPRRIELPARPVGDSWVRFPLAVGFLMALMALLHGALPEIFYDSQVYHLAVPETWLHQHALVDLPHRLFATFPYGGELCLWGGYLLGGSEAAKTLGVLAWIGAALVAGGWADELAGPTTGFFAAALVLTCPIYALTAWTTQVEGPLVLFSILALHVLDRAAERQRKRDWALAGLFLGQAVAVKYNAVFLAPFVLLALGRSHWRASWKAWLFLTLAALGVVMPWWIKNGVFSGNPFTPYFAGVWGGWGVDPQGFHQLLQEQRLWSVQKPLDWLTLPWRLVMDSPNGYNFTGPLFLVAPLVLLLPGARKDGERFLGWGSILFFILCFQVTHLLRFAAIGFAPLYLAAACRIGGEAPWFRRWMGALMGFMALVALLFLGVMSLVHYSPVGFWTGREDRSAYLDRAGVTPYFPLVRLVEKRLQPGDGLLLVGDARSLGYPGRTVANTVFDPQDLAVDAREEKDPAGILGRLRRRGVDLVAVNLQEGLRVSGGYHHYDLDDAAWKRLWEAFRWGSVLEGSDGQAFLYRLKPGMVPPESRAGPGTDASPFLYLASEVKPLVDAVRSGDAAAAEQSLGRLSGLQSFTPLWLEQEASMSQQAGHTADALRQWREAAGRGPLSLDGYRQWVAALQGSGHSAEVRTVERQARQWYPGNL